ncbi:xaa-pro aminopeptidase [Ecytonucleospora hepatopenaei]|uniref:Xaa-pro aminopeptidase n=1 Tax=Ecytonucleospora hepatopenaei TaxID=646526 RepID=A0A1W0E2V9_9MICR|nr:xaa-pro aminopeptidase [Ecytonucleospora hepatopenaei]
MRKENIVYLISDNTNAYLGDKILLHNNLTLQKTNIFDKESLNNISQAKDYYKMFFTNKVIYMQATKNSAEIAGMILSYFYDGIALCNTFGEIERVLMDKKENLTEIDCSNILLGHKKKFKDFFIQPSFETISSTGANCAIVHHTPGSDRINPYECYLMDSGSQYMFGTTDTTRTVLFGDFKKENKEESDKFLDMEYYEKLVHDNTLVLKCHLNVMISSYSKNDTWEMVDSRGREFLLKENKDYGPFFIPWCRTFFKCS